MYKLDDSLISVPDEDKPTFNTFSSSRRTHSTNFEIPQLNIVVTIPVWNSLQASIAETPTLESFKAGRIKKFSPK